MVLECLGGKKDMQREIMVKRMFLAFSTGILNLLISHKPQARCYLSSLLDLAGMPISAQQTPSNPFRVTPVSVLFI